MTEYEQRRDEAADKFDIEPGCDENGFDRYDLHHIAAAFKAGSDWCRNEWHEMGELKAKLRIATDLLTKFVDVGNPTYAKEALERLNAP